MHAVGLRAVAAVLVLGVASAGAAIPITTVPTGLNPGDHYRLVFLTSVSRDATSSDIDDYNAFVTGVAIAVPELLALGTTWMAIASTDAVDARDNTSTNPFIDGPGVPIYRFDDTKLVDGNDDLWDGFLDTALNVTNEGTQWSVSVWTGSSFEGVALAGDGLGGSVANTGYSGDTNSRWMFDNGGVTTGSFPYYAMSGVLIAVPEPGTAALLAMGLALVAIAARRHPRLPTRSGCTNGGEPSMDSRAKPLRSPRCDGDNVAVLHLGPINLLNGPRHPDLVGESGVFLALAYTLTAVRVGPGPRSARAPA